MKFQFALILFLILTIAFTQVSLKNPQDIRQFAKEPTPSEQSAQIKNNTPVLAQKIDTTKLADNIRQTTINLNNTASSVFQRIFTTVLAGLVFVLLFYLLLKKFLK